jgi:O-methyltransferase involved in polyketide biosynthesis
LVTAAARAAHLVVDGEPWIFEDRLAGVLLGDLAGDLLAPHRDARHAGVLASMRVAMTARSRYAEERLAEAVKLGTRHAVAAACREGHRRVDPDAR